MGWLRFSAMAFTLVFICIVLICVCGNPSRNDPLGVLNRFLTRTLPAAIKCDTGLCLASRDASSRCPHEPQEILEGYTN